MNARISWKTIALVAGLAAVISTLGLTACESSTTTITSTSTVPITREVLVFISPTLDTGDETPVSGIAFENIALGPGTLDKDYSAPSGDLASAPTGQGDPCYLLTGKIKNDYDERYWVAFGAKGYDAADKLVSVTLDAGPILGLAQVAVEGRSSEELTLHLSWSDTVSYYRVSSQRSPVMFP